MGKCSVCNKEFDDKYFDIEQNKCIYHCHKNEKNGWYEIKDNKKEWNPEKVKLFWEKVYTEISGINSVVGNKEVFNEIKDEYNREPFQYYFNKVIFPASIIDDIHYKSFFGLDKDINIYFDKCIFLSITDFELILKAKNVTFNNCRFFEDVEFKQMEFNGLFLFENCKVCKDIKFQNITFKKTTSFIKSKFYQELNFIHSRFDDLALFNEIKVKELLLDNTFFRGESNFLNITANMANRETARIIKNSFEQQNNIIEANRFYAKEMKKQEEELELEIKNKEKRNLKTIVDYFIFKLHGISSNHSQDPFLALYWIIIFGMTASLYEIYLSYICLFSLINIITINLFLISPVIINRLIEQKFHKYDKHYLAILYFLNYCFVISNCSPIECENTMSFAKTINPFSIMKGTDDIDILQLLFKITIAYLIYQFIVSIRQNTRRK